MIKKLLLLTIILTIILCSCGKENDNNKDNRQPSEAPQQEDIDPLKGQIDNMTLDEKIGQMVIVGLDGYEIDELTQDMIKQYKVGGFILFKRNIKDAYQTLTLINSLKEANKENKIPLFVAADEEGGSVSRMPDEFIKLPTSRAIGKIDSEDLAFEIGNIRPTIKIPRIYMNFAPVLDIDSNPNNPVIGNRSFGPNEDMVSRLGIAAMNGIQSHVISTVKHFPGHGDTSVDSHIGLPMVNHDIDRLNNFELVLFAKAIKEGTDGVMIAHILLPAIDEVYPATLSKKVISDILRAEMKFDGIVITDDMTMGAITENYDIGDAAVKSVLAGTDIVLVCHGYENQMKVIESLKLAVSNDIITEETLNDHVYRVLKLKQKYKLNDENIETVDIEGINRKINELLTKYMN